MVSAPRDGWRSMATYSVCRTEIIGLFPSSQATIRGFDCISPPRLLPIHPADAGALNRPINSVSGCESEEMSAGKM